MEEALSMIQQGADMINQGLQLLQGGGAGAGAGAPAQAPALEDIMAQAGGQGGQGGQEAR